MTTIAAVWESPESILIGADSGQKELKSGIRTKCAHKLERHKTAILVWGVSGNGSVAESFGKALQRWKPTTWDKLQAKAIVTLNECNKRQIQSAKDSGGLEYLESHMNFNPLVGAALVVGCLEGRLGGFTVDSLGQATSFHDELQFIGVASKEICVGYNAIRKICGEVSWQSFGKLLEAVSETMDGCDTPVHLLRITNNEIKELF